MAPVTRSHTRQVQSAFVKYVIEQPPIMQSIATHLQHRVTSCDDLSNLKLVFKSSRCNDVLNSSIQTSKTLNARVTYFGVTVTRKITEASALVTIFDRCDALFDIYEYILENLDVLVHKAFTQFLAMVLTKIDEHIVKVVNIDIRVANKFKHYRKIFIGINR